MRKIQISQTLKNIIVIVVIAVVFFFVGKVWPSGEEPTAITSDLLSQQIQSISELASVEYNYTNMGKFEKIILKFQTYFHLDHQDPLQR